MTDEQAKAQADHETRERNKRAGLVQSYQNGLIAKEDMDAILIRENLPKIRDDEVVEFKSITDSVTVESFFKAEPSETPTVEVGGVTLPPWTVEGVLVDIIVYQEIKRIAVVIPFQTIMTIDEERVTNLARFCHTVYHRLKEKCPAGWVII